MSIATLAAAAKRARCAPEPSEDTPAPAPGLRYELSNVLDVAGPNAIVAFLINDATSTWGGGVARQIAHRRPKVQAEFRRRAAADPDVLALGVAHVVESDDGIAFVALVAQAGVGPSRSPRIRYVALEAALTALGTVAEERAAEVHVPRLGAGASGGDWAVVEHLLLRTVASRVAVVVHDRPRRPARRRARALAETSEAE